MSASSRPLVRCVPTLIWRRGLFGSVFLMPERSRLNSAVVRFRPPSSRSNLAPISLLTVISGALSMLPVDSAKFSPEGWNERLYDT
ncbi:hypothetical protein D9M68_583150 [compost metagenome]